MALRASIGWLDFGEEDQRRAREYLAQFKGDNTLDELGFGTIRDALADLFFPGTNTIMTRTRYLVFIPALCMAVEREKLAGKNAERRLKELEDELRKVLSREEPTGVIGERAKESLSRYPSSIYWNSLRRLGVFLRPHWGLGYYLSHLAEFHKAMEAEKDDDGLSHLSNPEWRNWDKPLCDLLNDGQSFVTSKGEIPPSLGFALTRQEARYLQAKYKALAQKDGRPSLLSYLLENLPAESFTYPWEVPYPPALAQHVHHARCFSMFTRGATLQYFQLLQEERQVQGIDDAICDYADVFARWWEATRDDLIGWNVDEFLNLHGVQTAIRRNDRTFIKSWHGVNVKAANALEMWGNLDSRTLIRQRERVARPHKARLHHAEYLQRWKPFSSADLANIPGDQNRIRYALDYRGWIGSTFVQDIMAGL